MKTKAMKSHLLKLMIRRQERIMPTLTSVLSVALYLFTYVSE